MAQWIMLNQEEAMALFKEAIGGLSIQIAQAPMIRPVADYLQDGHSVRSPLTDAEIRAVVTSLSATTVAALGTFAFVYPYERYKKIAARYPDRNLNPSDAFGMGTYSNRHTFSARFPRTVIHTWNPRPGKASWFADCVRNSFAHAQSKYVVEGGQIGIEIINSEDGLNPNFSITMDVVEFWTLIREALNNFVATVVEGGVLQPLIKLSSDLV